MSVSRLRLGGLLTLLFAVTGLLGARPVTAEFTAGAADARGFQPLRLSVDLGGQERQVRLELELPPGGRISPKLGAFTAGGRVHVQILNVYVPRSAPAGAFTVRGTVIDGTRRWPFEASISVRANAKLLLIDEDDGFVTVRGSDSVDRTWRVTNTGNVLLKLRTSAMPATGAVVGATPAELTVAPGETREVTLTATLERPPDRLVTQLLFLNVDSAQGAYRQRDTVGFTAEFVPRTAGTGPLFAELTGEVLAGGVVGSDHHGMASRLRMEGEVLPGVNLLVYGADGTAATGGSRLGLATRDFLTVELDGKTWRAAGGVVNPPSFGFLENSVRGRGGTLAWSDGDGLVVTALAAREAFDDFSREHAGLHVARIYTDKTGWETGLLAQRNESGFSPAQERVGGFALAHWLWRGLTGSSQIAAAQDAAADHGPRIGLEQRLDYRTEDARSGGSVFVQTAPAGFFLDGRSVELRDATAYLATGPAGRLNLHWSESREQGLLRSYRQTEIEAGLTPTDPGFVELINRSGSEVRSWSSAYAVTVDENRAQLAVSRTDRTRDSGLPRRPEDTYREQAITADGSRNLRNSRLILTSSVTAGTEENPEGKADFLEASFSFGGQLTDQLQFTTDLRRTWHTGGTPNSGYRQPGTYGQGSLIWTPRPRWRVEAGINGYQFATAATRTRSYLLVEAPLTTHTALATEIAHDNQRTSFRLALRIHFSVPMRWQPVRGAITGRVRETNGAPVAGARLNLDGGAGLTDAQGRFTLPGRLPGSYPFTWNLPPAYVANTMWPRTVELHAGQLQTLELVAERIGLVTGTVTITRGDEIERPSGPMSATDETGRIVEAMAAAGQFRLMLPPGRYTVRFNGPLAPGIADQLVGHVIMDDAGTTAQVALVAVESVRGLRRTFFRDDTIPAKPPIGP